MYKKYLGNSIYVVMFLTVLSGLMEGIGIGLLVPLLEGLDSTESPTNLEDSDTLSQITSFILNQFGSDGSVESILVIIVVFFIMKFLFKFLALGYIGYLRGKLLFEIKTRIFDHYSDLDYVEYTKKNTGDMVNLLNVQTIRALQAFHFINTVVMSIVNSFIYIAIAALISIEFGIMALIGGGVLMLVMSLINKYVLNLSRQYTLDGGVLAKLVIQAMTGFKYLTATGRMSNIKPRVHESIKKLASSQSKLSVASAFSAAVSEPITIIFIVSIIFIQVNFFNESIEPILVSLVLFYKGLVTISSIQENYQNTLVHIGSMESIVKEVEAGGEVRKIDNRRIRIQAIEKNIQLKNIDYSYDKNSKKILGDLNIQIPSNKTVAIVGKSGSGKTTLIDMIIGIIYKQRGNIYIDGINADKINESSWRQLIGYVSQDEFVFDDTVANNITFWEGDWKKDKTLHKKIISSLKESDFYDTVMQLPEGLDTVIGDRGVFLSGGQKQRLFIARELFRSPKLLILDEATSSLDSNSEISISKSINRMHGSTTIVIIAHRLNTIMSADIIYVIDGGKIVEQGSFKELMLNDNSYISTMASGNV